MLAALLKFRLLFCFFIGIRSLFLVVKEFNISEGNPEVSFPNKKASSISNLRENKFSFPNFIFQVSFISPLNNLRAPNFENLHPSSDMTLPSLYLL